MVECPECGANADVTGDGSMAHCASCNNIFEPNTGKGEKGTGSGSGDPSSDKSASTSTPDSDAATDKSSTRANAGDAKPEKTRKKEWTSGIKPAAEWAD